MGDFETIEAEIQEIRKKILNSDNKIKKKLMNEEELKEISSNLKKMSTEQIKKIIDYKIAQIKEKKLDSEELEKLECEIALLITNLPLNIKKSFEYWKGIEKNAKK